MRRRTATGCVLGVVVVATVIAGCTSKAKSGSTGSNIGSGSAAVGAADLPSAAGAPTRAAAQPAAGGAGFDAAKLSLGGASVIRTADLTVSAGNVGAQADRARLIATDVGGSVDGDDRTSGMNATATLTLRVPPQSLGDVLSRLALLGKEQSRHQSSRDVTTEVADVDSRVRSATSAIAQLRALYDKATRVSDIITIETELNQRETDLESLQAQQRALAGQVSMATVTLYLVTPAPVAHHHKSHGGIVGGFTNGWHAFTRAAVALVTGVGAALPFLVLLALAWAVWLGVRRRRSDGGASPTSPPAPEPSS
jgi:hypothetical protein